MGTFPVFSCSEDGFSDSPNDPSGDPALDHEKRPQPCIAELLLKHTGRVRRIISRRAGVAVLQKTSPEDLFNDIAAEALRCSATFAYRGDAAFLGWIETIAKRVMARVVEGTQGYAPPLRIRGVESQGVGISEEVLRSPERTPSSIVQGGELRDLLLQAIQQLPTDHRHAVVLRGLARAPISEVADRLERSEKAAFEVFYRALRLLKRLMEQRLGSTSTRS